MLRFSIIAVLAVFSVFCAQGRRSGVVVADSVTRFPLAGATVFDRKGKGVGVSDPWGRLPSVSAGSYPLTVRNFGFGRRSLFLLKQATGISAIKSRRNMKNKWKEFRKGRLRGKEEGKGERAGN